MCSVEWTPSQVTGTEMAFQLNAVANAITAQVINISIILCSLEFVNEENYEKLTEKLLSNIFQFSMDRQIAMLLSRLVLILLDRVLFKFQVLQSQMQEQDFNHLTHFVVNF